MNIKTPEYWNKNFPEVTTDVVNAIQSDVIKNIKELVLPALTDTESGCACEVCQYHTPLIATALEELKGL